MPAGMLAGLEAYRDRTFHRLKKGRVTGERSALDFIDRAGFCTAFTAGLGVPCLREAIAGEREPALPEHIQHDYAIGKTWELKNRLPEKRRVYYGKVIGGRPGFIALDLLPAFLRLRVAPGGYRSLYARGELSHCARAVIEVLHKRGPAETRVLKLSSGFARPREGAQFDRAMKELQEKFLALKVGERYDPFTYVWDTMERRWGGALRAARDIAPHAAALRIVRRYLEVAGFGSERVIARLITIDPALVERAARRLEREGLIARGIRIEGLNGKYCVLTTLLG